MAAFKVNIAVPEEPVVEVGDPPHFVMAPAMPPHIPSSATFWSWNTILLVCVRSGAGCFFFSRKEAYAVVSIQVVPVMALGSTFVEARMAMTSKCSCLTVTEGNGMAETVVEAARMRVMMLEVYIVISF